jgi:Zn-dependent membrane protease YugP
MYFLFVGPGMLLALWAQYKVKSAFNSGHEIPVASGLSGAQVAQKILDAYSIKNVGIEEANGFMGDHYDPKAKMLRLSHEVYSGRSISSFGVRPEFFGGKAVVTWYPANDGALELFKSVLFVNGSNGKFFFCIEFIITWFVKANHNSKQFF